MNSLDKEGMTAHECEKDCKLDLHVVSTKKERKLGAARKPQTPCEERKRRLIMGAGRHVGLAFDRGVRIIDDMMRYRSLKSQLKLRRDA